jgi:hypothetical protein
MVVGTQTIFIALFGALKRFLLLCQSNVRRSDDDLIYFDLEPIMRLADCPRAVARRLDLGRHILSICLPCFHGDAGL